MPDKPAYVKDFVFARGLAALEPYELAVKACFRKPNPVGIANDAAGVRAHIAVYHKLRAAAYRKVFGAHAVIKAADNAAQVYPSGENGNIAVAYKVFHDVVGVILFRGLNRKVYGAYITRDPAHEGGMNALPLLLEAPGVLVGNAVCKKGRVACNAAKLYGARRGAQYAAEVNLNAVGVAYLVLHRRGGVLVYGKLKGYIAVNGNVAYLCIAERVAYKPSGVNVLGVIHIVVIYIKDKVFYFGVSGKAEEAHRRVALVYYRLPVAVLRQRVFNDLYARNAVPVSVKGRAKGIVVGCPDGCPFPAAEVDIVHQFVSEPVEIGAEVILKF